jgi:hypothetical protein
VSESDFEPLDVGTRRGCAVALLVGAPVGLFLMLLHALGDGESKASLWRNDVLPTAILGMIVFLGTRWLTNRRYSIARAHWPKDVPERLSKAVLKPILLSLLDPTNILKEIDFIPHSAWPNSTQLNHYLFDCRRANPEEEEALRASARQVIEAAKQDEEIRLRWNFLTDCGLVLRFGIYDDPGISSLWLQIVRSPESEAKLRATTTS